MVEGNAVRPVRAGSGSASIENFVASFVDDDLPNHVECMPAPEKKSVSCGEQDEIASSFTLSGSGQRQIKRRRVRRERSVDRSSNG